MTLERDLDRLLNHMDEYMQSPIQMTPELIEIQRQVNEAIASQSVAVDYAAPGDDVTIVSQIRGNKPTMIIIDEVFDAERMREQMRALDLLFVHGNGTCSAPPAGYLTATATPAGPATTMPTYPQINSLLQGLLSRLKDCP